MPFNTREMIAYGLILAIVGTAIPITIRMMMKNQRERLRRKGIKRYNR